MELFNALLESHPFALALVVISLWAAALSPVVFVFAVWRHLRYMRRIADTLEVMERGEYARMRMDFDGALAKYGQGSPAVMGYVGEHEEKDAHKG